jgi:serine/threonine-protein kinase
MLDGLNRARRRRQWMKRGAQAGVALAILAVLGTGGYFLLRSGPANVDPARTDTPQPGPSTLPPDPAVGPPDPSTKPQAAEPGLNAPLQPPTPLSVPPANLPSEDPAQAKKPPVRTEPPRLEPSRPAKVRVSILVRPYGAIQVDKEAPSPQPLAQHDLELTPGPHSVTVRCEWCEDAVETIDVVADAENVFRLRAQLKPSRLSFDYQPAEAQVRVAGEVRTARESMEHPFDIRSPRGPASFQHRVEYEVSYPGYRTEKRVVSIEPGKPVTLSGSLVAE